MSETQTVTSEDILVVDADATALPLLTDEQFLDRWNLVAGGEAKFDERSEVIKNKKGEDTVKKITPIVGETVPKSRGGVAVFCGMSYNAVINREKSYRLSMQEQKLDDTALMTVITPGKKGRSHNWVAVADKLQIDATAKEIASESDEPATTE